MTNREGKTEPMDLKALLSADADLLRPLVEAIVQATLEPGMTEAAQPVLANGGPGIVPAAVLNAMKQAAVQARVKREIRTNTYDAVAEIIIGPLRAEVIRKVAAHYRALVSDAAVSDMLDHCRSRSPPGNAHRSGGVSRWLVP